MIGLTLFSIYLISVLRVRRWIRIAYSKDGFRSGCSVDMSEIMVTFTPILNTGIMIGCMFQSPYMNGKDKKQKMLEKFYGIKEK
jgi:hypothetical protein